MKLKQKKSITKRISITKNHFLTKKAGTRHRLTTKGKKHQTSCKKMAIMLKSDINKLAHFLRMY